MGGGLLFSENICLIYTIHFWLITVISILLLAIISVNLDRAKKISNQLATIYLNNIQECMGLEGRPYLVARTKIIDKYNDPKTTVSNQELGFHFTYVSKQFEEEFMQRLGSSVIEDLIFCKIDNQVLE